MRCNLRLNRPRPRNTVVSGLSGLCGLAAIAATLLGCSMLQPAAPSAGPPAAASATPPVPPSLDAFEADPAWTPTDVWDAVPDARGRLIVAGLKAVPSNERQNPPRVLIHDLTTGEDVGPVEVADPLAGSGARGLAVSPDGSEVAIGSAARVDLLTTADGTQLEPLIRSPNGGGVIRSLAFTPDGSQVVALVGYELVSWDRKTGEVTAHWSTGKEYPRRLAVSPDGTLVATGGDTGIVLRRLADGSVACSGSPGRILGVAFSPDGHHVAGWAYDGTYRLMDTDCTHQAQWPGEAKFVPNVAYRGDGSSLLAAGNDGVLRAWNVATHGVDSTLQLNGKGPFMVHPFNQDQSLLVVDLAAHSAQIWKAR